MSLPGKKLGKLAPRHDKRTLQFANYLKPKALPTPPDSVDWASKVGPDWNMLLNDQLGCCTISGAAHMIEAWSTYATSKVVLPDSAILAAYEANSGYNPVTGENDNGCVESDVLNYWKNTGIGGHKIAAFMALEPGNHWHIKAAIQLFGGVYLGVALPLSAQDQKVWSVAPGGPVGQNAPGSWGGHCINLVEYDPQLLTCVTWGALQQLTWQWNDQYVDEAYAVLSEDWLNVQHVAPSGFDMATLAADLQALDGSVSRTLTRLV